jgi:hypothetical protein
MLSDSVRQLLVSFVDGELPAGQRETASRLLEQSAEAREFVRRLEADAAALRRMPRRRLSSDFPQKVLGSLGERRFSAARRARLGQSPVYPTWIGVAAAAAVLLVIGVGTGLYFASLPDTPPRVAVAKNATTRPEKNKEPRVERKPEPSPAPKDTPSPSPTEPKPQANIPEEKSIVADNRPVLEFTSEADFAMEAAPTRRLEVFQELENIKLALSLTLRELDQPRAQERLKEMLKEDTSFHLDLSCPANAKGLDRLEAAFQAKGVKLVIDKAALTRWKKGLKTHYALYTEDLMPEELAGILQTLGSDDKKAEPKQRFNKIVINHLTPSDRGEICTLLGVDPRVASVKPKGPLGVDITQPLSKKTEQQLADSLAGKGTPRPEPGKAAAPKAPDRFALVLSYNPVRASPASSKEVKQFLATRPGQRPGAVQILLVLRAG